MEILLFDEVADAVRGMMPAGLGPVRLRVRRYGIKVWFGPLAPPRAHYEAQVIGPGGVKGATTLALEIGFHAEHPHPEDNDAAVSALTRVERKWRKRLGPEPTAGPFIGRPDDWRRVSETWADPDLSDPELGFEIATRVIDYIIAFEPILRAGS